MSPSVTHLAAAIVGVRLETQDGPLVIAPGTIACFKLGEALWPSRVGQRPALRHHPADRLAHKGLSRREIQKAF